jgi:hypothetical protein
MQKLLNKRWLLTLLLGVAMVGCNDDDNGGGGVPAPAICQQGSSCVSLGTAADFVILAQTGIANTPTSAVIGDMGITPAFAASITGFGTPAVDATNDFSTSSEVTGKIYAPDYTGGQPGSAGTTPAKMTTAQTDMGLAYDDAFGRPAGVGATNLNVGGGTLSGLDFVPGTYTWDTPGDVNITGNITLTGTATDVWIFQMSGILTQASATTVTLVGALPQNVFWQAAGGVAISTTAHMEGVILSKTTITLDTGASANGRLLAQTAVTLGAATVTQP